jgi:1-acyl-sn-glycerol-3-phosphate acyltransferase
MATDESVSTRVERLELPFNALGVDPYGISKKHLVLMFSALRLLYRHYFRVQAVGTGHVPARTRAMLVGNHSGGYAIDGALVIASMFFELGPPRLAQGMAEKFINALPVGSLWSSRTGQFTGLPEHAHRLLEDDRLLMVFPEGARGTAKLYRDRYSLVDFGTGFVRLALKTKTPIVPLGFVGGGDAIPSIYNAVGLGKLLGVPYVPVTPWGLALPLPVSCQVHYGAPLRFEGTGDEEDAVIRGYVDQVKGRILELMAEARAARRSRALGGDK